MSTSTPKSYATDKDVANAALRDCDNIRRFKEMLMDTTPTWNIRQRKWTNKYTYSPSGVADQINQGEYYELYSWFKDQSQSDRQKMYNAFSRGLREAREAISQNQWEPKPPQVIDGSNRMQPRSTGTSTSSSERVDDRDTFNGSTEFDNNSEMSEISLPSNLGANDGSSVSLMPMSVDSTSGLTADMNKINLHLEDMSIQSLRSKSQARSSSAVKKNPSTLNPIPEETKDDVSMSIASPKHVTNCRSLMLDVLMDNRRHEEDKEVAFEAVQLLEKPYHQTMDHFAQHIDEKFPLPSQRVEAAKILFDVARRIMKSEAKKG